MRDQQDAVADGDAAQRDEADQARDGQRLPGEHQRQHAADERRRQGIEDLQRRSAPTDRASSARRTCRRPRRPPGWRSSWWPAAGSRTARRTRRSSPPAGSTWRRRGCWMSATTLARSRPCVLQRMTMRRRAFSRLTAFGPTPSPMSASSRSSTWPRPSGRSIRSRPRLA